MKTAARAGRSSDAERQLEAFIGKFDPICRRSFARRAARRASFPTANELAYDNYNFFVIGYGPTERPSIASFLAARTVWACASSAARR
jgi:hypothetical protein